MLARNSFLHFFPFLKAGRDKSAIYDWSNFFPYHPLRERIKKKEEGLSLHFTLAATENEKFCPLLFPFSPAVKLEKKITPVLFLSLRIEKNYPNSIQRERERDRPAVRKKAQKDMRGNRRFKKFFISFCFILAQNSAVFAHKSRNEEKSQSSFAQN